MLLNLPNDSSRIVPSAYPSLFGSDSLEYPNWHSIILPSS